MRAAAARSVLLVVATGVLLVSTASILDSVPDVDDDDEGGDEDYETPTMDAFGFARQGDDEGYGALFDREAVYRSRVDRLFELLDENKDSKLSTSEIKRGLEQQYRQYQESLAKHQKKNAQYVLDSADADSDDVLSLEEWQDAELPANHDQLTSDDLFTFADAGADGLQPADGKLTLDEVIHALHPDTSARLRDYQRVVARRVLRRLCAFRDRLRAGHGA